MDVLTRRGSVGLAAAAADRAAARGVAPTRAHTQDAAAAHDQNVDQDLRASGVPLLVVVVAVGAVVVRVVRFTRVAIAYEYARLLAARPGPWLDKRSKQSIERWRPLRCD